MSDDDESSDPGPCTRRGGCLPGRPNYQNNILIPITERILPDGADGRHLVALAYKEESKEEMLRAEDDIKKNWVKKLCNNFKKPTGRTGQDIEDQVAHCVAIDWRIRNKSRAGILGTSSDDENNVKLSASSALSLSDLSIVSQTHVQLPALPPWPADDSAKAAAGNDDTNEADPPANINEDITTDDDGNVDTDCATTNHAITDSAITDLATTNYQAHYPEEVQSQEVVLQHLQHKNEELY